MNYIFALKHLVVAAIVLLLASSWLLIPMTSHAQEPIECGTIAEPELSPEEKELREPFPALTPTIVRHVNVYVHVVRYDNGSGGISEGNIVTALQQLNTAFSDVTVIFDRIGTDFIDNSTYANIESLSEVFALWNLGYFQPNVLNIYFVPAAYFNGIAAFPGRNLIVKNAVATNGSTLAHEVGHNFYLRHTHSDAVDPPSNCNPVTPLELVNGSNCTSAGDYLCDTPAEPFNCGSGILGYVNSSCVYTGTFRDPNTELYTPNTRNFMGYSLASCRNMFTEGQINVMQNYLRTQFDLLSTSVAVSNEVNGVTHSSSTLTINNQVITSPGSINLIDGNTYPGKTNHERLLGHNKHKDWNQIVSEYTLSKDFTVNRTTELGRTRKARFITLSPVTITTELIETGGVGGNVQFRDPWYLADASGNQPNQFFTYNAPFLPTGAYNQSMGGVFLGQEVSGGLPYYSVGAPNPQIIGGFEACFAKWDDSNPTQVQFKNPTAQRTGVVFKQAGATARALYKGHMISSTPHALSPTTGTHVAEGRGASVNPLYTFYESGNYIFLTSSIDRGITWNCESFAIDGTYPSILPNLTVGGDIYFVYTVSNGWINFGQATSSGEIRQIDGLANVGLPLKSAALGYYSYGTDNRIYVVWNDGDSLRYKYRYYPGVWSNVGTVPRSNEWESGPTMSRSRSSLDDADYLYLLTRRDDLVLGPDTDPEGLLVLRRLIELNRTIQWSDYRAVPSSSGDPRNYQVQGQNQESSTMGYAHVVWEANYPNAPPRIYYKRFRETSYWDGTWDVGYAWEGKYFTHPSITLYDRGDMAIIWSTRHDGDREPYIYRVQKIATQWRPVTRMEAGTNPHLATGFVRPSITDQRYVFTQKNYTPSGVPFWRLNVGPSSGTDEVETQYVREIALTEDDEPVIEITVEEVESASEGDNSLLRRRHRFVNIPDTIRFRGIHEVYHALSTEPIRISPTVSENDSIIVTGTIRLRRLLSGPMSIEYVAIDSATGLVLRILSRIAMINGLQQFREAASLAGLGRRTIVVSPRIQGLLSLRRFQANMTHVYRVMEQTASPKVLAGTTTSIENASLPEVFALAQNHPNPFNPRTVIDYQLPIDAHVVLKVYDLLGRVVATLVDEQKPAGYHRATFDAAAVGSGVYFYRMAAGNYTAVRKMVVVK